MGVVGSPLDTKFMEDCAKVQRLGQDSEQELRELKFDFFERQKAAIENRLLKIDPERVYPVNANLGLIQKIYDWVIKNFRIFVYSKELQILKAVEIKVDSSLGMLNDYKASKLKTFQLIRDLEQELPTNDVQEVRNEEPQGYLDMAANYIDPWTNNLFSRVTNAVSNGASYVNSGVSYIGSSRVVSAGTNFASYLGSFFVSNDPANINAEEPSVTQEVEDEIQDESISNDRDDDFELIEEDILLPSQPQNTIQVNPRAVSPNNPALQHLRGIFRMSIPSLNPESIILDDGTKVDLFEELFKLFFRPDEMSSIQLNEDGEFHIKYEDSTEFALQGNAKLTLPKELKFKYKPTELQNGTYDHVFEFSGSTKPVAEGSFAFLSGSFNLSSLTFNGNTIEAKLNWVPKKISIPLSNLVNNLIIAPRVQPQIQSE